MAILGEEGIDSRQRRQTPYIKVFLRQYFSMHGKLADLMTVIESIAEKGNEDAKMIFLYKTVLKSTKNSVEVHGVIPDKTIISVSISSI